jgi:hypothetical protein
MTQHPCAEFNQSSPGSNNWATLQDGVWSHRRRAGPCWKQNVAEPNSDESACAHCVKIKGEDCVLEAIFAIVAISTLLVSPVFADSTKGNNGNSNGNGGPRGAPEPVLGAGLPILAVGYGVYWVVRRREEVTETSNGRSSRLQAIN